MSFFGPKLTSGDKEKLAHLKRRVEWLPGPGPSADNLQALDEVLRDTTPDEQGRVLIPKAAIPHSAIPTQQETTDLSGGVRVKYTVNRHPMFLHRHASVSRRGRLSAKWITEIAEELGFEHARLMQNPDSGVWHMIEIARTEPQETS
jgi:hypothetical protein